MTADRNRKGWSDPLVRPIPVSSIGSSGLEIEVTPSAQELVAIAGALGLAAVETLKGAFRLTHRAGGQIAVTGEVRGVVQPVCVVSLEPFSMTIREKVEVRFAETAEEPDEDEIDLNGGEDPPDLIENGVIDLGRVTTEFLSLALPMFPRKPEAAFDGAGDDKPASPFAALAALKPKA